jgi:hypothetical protein
VADIIALDRGFFGPRLWTVRADALAVGMPAWSRCARRGLMNEVSAGMHARSIVPRYFRQPARKYGLGAFRCKHSRGLRNRNLEQSWVSVSTYAVPSSA